MRSRIVMAVAASVALVAGLSACGSASSSGSGGSGGSGGTVTVGMSAALSGSVASLGQTALQGLQMAVDDINAKGGLLGKQVKVVSADGQAKPATGAANVRSMITSDKAVAIFGPTASSVASAEQQVAAQYKIPLFLWGSNDVSLMTKTFTPYAFQNVPNTVMEPRAIAAYLAQKVGTKPITLATFAPDYSYGHDTVDSFLQALKDKHVNFTLVHQAFPPLGASNISADLSALVAANPEYVFNAQYGGDLVAFTKQAQQFGLFQHTTVISFYNYDVLPALGDQVPAGAIGYARAPFWGVDTPEMATFVKNYHAKYNAYPTDWAALNYAAAQQWAWAVQQGGSFDADKVIKVLPGAAPPTILGNVTIRACDHQSQLPEYVGTVSAQGDSQYGGVHLWDKPVFTAPFQDIALTCEQAQAMQPH